MRLAVRHQLSLLLILSSSVGLATLAIATWVANHDLVLKVARDGLEAAASLKSVELAVSLDLMYTSCLYLTTSTPVQQALARYNNGSNTSSQNWNAAAADMAAALSSLGSLKHAPGVQSQVRAPDTPNSVLNTTGAGNREIAWQSEDGALVHLGEGALGYPPSLYPNLTISDERADPTTATYLATYDGRTLGLKSNLILGPFIVNENLSLISMTLPIIENNSETNVLGWLTVVQDARLIQSVVNDRTGLGRTGQTLLFGPVNATNDFTPGVLGSHPTKQQEVRFLLPVKGSSTTSRHAASTADAPFPASAYPAVDAAISDGFQGTRELGSMLNTHNENGDKVSVAYSTPPTELVNWIVVVERTQQDVWQPVVHLRTIILACLFSVLGFFFFASLPIAHWAVRPITRLKAATESTIDPLYAESNSSDRSGHRAAEGPMVVADDLSEPKTSFLGSLLPWRQKNHAVGRYDNYYGRQKRFRIPSKVDTSKHWVKDDLSDLMETFNEMSDELILQYSKLEERVQRRTVQLEQSKKAAEEANESKTLFVANVSHELKTPLNGILGMCATSIEEDDVGQMKTSLSIIYKSGDLLLRTLNDLLTFSTNQVGSRELMLEEREFVLQDVEAQVLTIFEKQAMDKSIKLSVQYEDALPTGFGQFGQTARLRDMTLWGDVHRILQIIINLVSNSLKYTPAEGSITVLIKRSVESAPRRLRFGLEQLSVQSNRTNRSVVRRSDRGGTANFINPTEGVQLQERSVAPPGNDFYVEFVVRDTGQGIPEDMQSRVFEPFVQGEVGLNRRHSGTGLGLSICSQLATLMKGSIDLQSHPGKGSTFTVKIPLRNVMGTPTTKTSQAQLSRPTSWAESEKEGKSDSDKGTDSDRGASRVESRTERRGIPMTIAQPAETKDEAPKASPDVKEPPSVAAQPTEAAPSTAKRVRKKSKDVENADQRDFSKLRVLVAEDNKVNQQVILRMLKMEQILQVTIAEDGQQALDNVKTLHGPESPETPPYDMIFMDIQMPNMDGLTSTRLIRESGYDKPIVALTAYAQQKNMDDCYESGMNHFLAKPLQRPQLHEVLVKVQDEKASEVPQGQTPKVE